MFRNFTCPKCRNQDERLFSILGYTNAFKIPSAPGIAVIVIVRCEVRSCKNEFEVIEKKG